MSKKTFKQIFSVKNIILGFIFLSFLVATIWLAIRMMNTYTLYPAEREREYFFLFLQGIIGMIAMILPSIVKRVMRLDIPPIQIILYALFIYGSLYLGSIMDLYYILHHWDTGLHLASGIVLGLMGFGMVDLLNKEKPVSPLLATLFAFCFASTLGVIWEIYEFTVDSILDTNTQRYACFATGEPFVGQEACLIL